MEDANAKEHREFFSAIRQRTSQSQWDEIMRILGEMYADGVQKLTGQDVIAIVEVVVLGTEENVTVDDLEKF